MSEFPFNLTKGEGKISLVMTQNQRSIKVKTENSNYIKKFFTGKPVHHKQNQRWIDN